LGITLPDVFLGLYTSLHAGSITSDAAASVRERTGGIGKKKAPTATADDITRILSVKDQQKKIKAADAKSLLEKYGAKSLSTLNPQDYDAVLEEASSMLDHHDSDLIHSYAWLPG